MSDSRTPIKIIVVGDGMVGKTCLLITYALRKFPAEYIPTVFENYSASVPVGNQTVDFELWDTAGQEEYSHLRPLTYPNTDVIILCFSVVQQSSFDNIETRWMKEIKGSAVLRNKPIILVGTKVDARGELSKLSVNPVIFYEKGKRLAKRIGAEAYMECSALHETGVKDIFDRALMCAIQKRDGQSHKSKCSIM